MRCLKNHRQIIPVISMPGPLIVSDSVDSILEITDKLTKPNLKNETKCAEANGLQEFWSKNSTVGSK